MPVLCVSTYWYRHNWHLQMIGLQDVCPFFQVDAVHWHLQVGHGHRTRRGPAWSQRLRTSVTVIQVQSFASVLELALSRSPSDGVRLPGSDRVCAAAAGGGQDTATEWARRAGPPSDQ